MTDDHKAVPLHAGFFSSSSDAAKPRPHVSESSDIQRLQIGGDHIQAVTGKAVAYKVDLDHGSESSNYAARVLLLGAKWHELEGGTATGQDRSARTQEILTSVLAQIDRLDFDALNRG